MAPFSHRHAAVLAGMGEFGYNNLVITPEYSPRIRFMSVVTEAEIEQDSLLETPLCLGESCLACVKSGGLPNEGIHAIKPVANRTDGIFINMPSVVDKTACFN